MQIRFTLLKFSIQILANDFLGHATLNLSTMEMSIKSQDFYEENI